MATSIKPLVTRKIYNWTLKVYDHGVDSRGAMRVTFSLTLPDKTVLYRTNANDTRHYCSAWGIDRAIAAAWEYVTMRIGDTDSDFFDNYSESELNWIKSSACEELSCYVSDRFN